MSASMAVYVAVCLYRAKSYAGGDRPLEQSAIMNYHWSLRKLALSARVRQ